MWGFKYDPAISFQKFIYLYFYLFLQALNADPLLEVTLEEKPEVSLTGWEAFWKNMDASNIK
jgi:hypothetical protein